MNFARQAKTAAIRAASKNRLPYRSGPAVRPMPWTKGPRKPWTRGHETNAKNHRMRTAMNAPVNIDLKARATSLPLENLDPSDPRLYYEDVWQPYFERLRREAPVHSCHGQPIRPILVRRQIPATSSRSRSITRYSRPPTNSAASRSTTPRKAWSAPASSAWIRRNTMTSGAKSVRPSIRSRSPRWKT